MARHTEIAAALATTEIYFCDPHSPELNRRPRKILGWDNPADRLATLIRSPSVLRR